MVDTYIGKVKRAKWAGTKPQVLNGLPASMVWGTKKISGIHFSCAQRNYDLCGGHWHTALSIHRILKITTMPMPMPTHTHSVAAKCPGKLIESYYLFSECWNNNIDDDNKCCSTNAVSGGREVKSIRYDLMHEIVVEQIIIAMTIIMSVIWHGFGCEATK